MKRARIALSYMALVVSLSMMLTLAHGDEDSDSRTPVVVKTKRSSIVPRSLPHLIELAEGHSPAIQSANADLATARLNFEVAARQWYPTLDVSTFVGLRGNQPTQTDIAPTPW